MLKRCEVESRVRIFNRFEVGRKPNMDMQAAVLGDQCAVIGGCSAVKSLY